MTTDAGLEYILANEAERAELEAEALAADRLEASSIRYGVWVRVAYLTSGRWAVYHEAEPGGGQETGTIEIFDSLDPDYLRTLSINEQAKLEEHRLSILEGLDAKPNRPSIVQHSTANLEEMGL